MRFLRKPAVAVIIAVLLVSIFTLGAAGVKIQSLSNDVIYGFYDGVEDDEGILQASIESSLRIIMTQAQDIGLIAGDYGIDTEALYDSVSYLENSITYSEKYMSYIYDNYDELMTEIKSVRRQLKDISLSAGDEEAIEAAAAEILAQEELIGSSNYNATVRAFERAHDSALFMWFADAAGVTLPEAFA